MAPKTKEASQIRIDVSGNPGPAAEQFHQTTDTENEQETENEPTTLLDVFNFREDLCSHGDICAAGEAKELPVVPGLHVKGVGAIPLPLVPETAEKLRKVCQEAPHSRGMESRNILEIKADQFTLENSCWDSGLKQLVKRGISSLGVDASRVTPKLTKMLVYDEGGFFKKHRDAEKEDGMFANLVVQLPSIFKGGSFAAHHNGRESKFSFDSPSTAAYQCQFVAHYADCEHEMLPIESGNRLDLVYSLYHTGKEATKPTAEDIYDGDVVSILSKLRKSDSLFAVPLFHDYPTSSLSQYGIGCLKDFDRAWSRSILQASGWKMGIVRLEKEDEESGYMHPFDGFEANYVEHDGPFFKDMFDENGECSVSHHEWLTEDLDLESIEDGGMILAEKDEWEDKWKEIDSTEPECNGSAEFDRVVTYETYVLIAFSFERICRNRFSDAIDQVENEPNLFNRAIDYLKSEKPKLSHCDFLRLHKLLQDEEARCYSHSELLGIMFRCLDESKVPPDNFFSFVGSWITEWASGATLPLLSAANDALTKKDSRCKSANEAEAKDKCIKFIRDRVCHLEDEQLRQPSPAKRFRKDVEAIVVE